MSTYIAEVLGTAGHELRIRFEERRRTWFGFGPEVTTRLRFFRGWCTVWHDEATGRMVGGWVESALTARWQLWKDARDDASR